MEKNMNQQYLEQAVTSMTRGELVVFTCDIALMNISKAMVALEKKDIPNTHNFIIKAQHAVHYLMDTLNTDIPISKELMPLYDFINNQLIQANVRKDPELLIQSQQLMSELKSTWKQAEREYQGSKK